MAPHGMEMGAFHTLCLQVWGKHFAVSLEYERLTLASSVQVSVAVERRAFTLCEDVVHTLRC